MKSKMPKIKSMRFINKVRYNRNRRFIVDDDQELDGKDIWELIYALIDEREIGTFAKGDSVTITQVGKGK